MPAAILLLSAIGANADQPSTFATFLAGRDVVVIGTVLSVSHSMRYKAGPCAGSTTDSLELTRVTLSVDEVLVGAVDDSFITISTPLEPRLPGSRTLVRRKVIAWAYHECSDDWRLWGRLAGVGGGGAIVPPIGDDPALFSTPTDSTTGTATLAALRAGIRDASDRVGAASLDGSRAVGLGRIATLSADEHGHRVFAIDSLGWTLGSASNMPHRIESPIDRDCLPNSLPGDTILVPVTADPTPLSIEVSGCVRILAVKYGYVPALGLPLSSLPRALETVGGRVRVRHYIARE